MGRTTRAVWAGVLLLLQGCGKEQPVPFRDPQMGIAVVFPGQPSKVRFEEPSPFGSMEWFGRSFRPPGRLDTTFQVDVANLPPGTRGGGTPAEVLETYQRWLVQRFTKVDRQELPLDRGPRLPLPGGRSHGYASAGPPGGEAWTAAPSRSQYSQTR